MVPTTKRYQNLLAAYDQQIDAMEAALVERSHDANLREAVTELWRKRRALKLLLINRAAEGAKKVVDLGRWRDGNGAAAELASKPVGRAA